MTIDTLVSRQSRFFREAEVILLAAPFGLGPLSKALSLADALKGDGHRVVLFADPDGVAIAARLGYHAAMYTYREPLDLTETSARVIVSCLDISTPLERSGAQLVVVDSLHWMRGTWEREYTGSAELYVAQRFADTGVARPGVASNVKTVDAILGKEFIALEPHDKPLNTAVIYPGGLGSPYISKDCRELYVEWVMAGFLAAASSTSFDVTSSTLVLPNRNVATPSMRRFCNRGGIVSSDYAMLPNLLRRAGHAVIAPGIEISLESAAIGHDPLFLPAFNGSHVAQMPILEEHHFGRIAVPAHLDQIRSRIGPRKNLRSTTASVQSFNSSWLGSYRFRTEFHDSLSEELSQGPRQLQPRYPLGKDGVRQTVSLIRGLLS